jgi:hypothetical protein
MPYNEFDFEQTAAMRAAIDMVVAVLGDTFDRRRTEVAQIVINLANQADYNAPTLATMVLDALDRRKIRVGVGG